MSALGTGNHRGLLHETNSAALTPLPLADTNGEVEGELNVLP
jgi:hypothetical protein